MSSRRSTKSRRSGRRSGSQTRNNNNGDEHASDNIDNGDVEDEEGNEAEGDGEGEGEGTAAARLRSDIAQRNRAVAEREAARLARPEARTIGKLGHASRKRSAVSSTPSGYRESQRAAAAPQPEWSGPFTVARQMLAKRHEARRKREAELEESQSSANPHPLDYLLEEVEEDRKRKAHPSLKWKGNVSEDQMRIGSLYSKRQKREQVLQQTRGLNIPSLFQTCVNFLVDNFEHVEGLGDVDSSIRRAICEELVVKNKLDAQAFEAIAEVGIEALELVDCAGVTQAQLAEALKRLLPAGLKYLLLHHSGRCFGPKVVEAIQSTKGSLFAISIAGAYVLKDADSSALVESIGETLSSLEFKACPLLGDGFCKSINTVYSSDGSGTLIELSLEDLSLTKDQLLTLAGSDALRNIKSLSLRQIGVVDDEVVCRLLDQVGTDLESLDLSFNHELTDECLSAIRKCNKTGSLRSLQLGGLKNLTQIGLEALFMPNIEGLPSPPMLRRVSFANCYHEAVTDDVMELVTKASSMKRENGQVSDILSSLGGLVYLNINGSSCTDTTMEHLAATSASSLTELDMGFCAKISDKGIGYLVSKASYLFKKLHVWGCAQLTDEFYDGHDRADDGNFEIIGTWMKRYGGVMKPSPTIK